MRTAGPSRRDEDAARGGRPARSTAASGGDDLRRRAMVHGQLDDLDARHAIGDVDEQARVGAVEAVDRLRRIADEVEVAAAADELLEERGTAAG